MLTYLLLICCPATQQPLYWPCKPRQPHILGRHSLFSHIGPETIPVHYICILCLFAGIMNLEFILKLELEVLKISAIEI